MRTAGQTDKGTPTVPGKINNNLELALQWKTLLKSLWHVLTFYQSSFEQFCDSKQWRFPVACGQLHALVGQVAQSLDKVFDGWVGQVTRRFEKPMRFFKLVSFNILGRKRCRHRHPITFSLEIRTFMLKESHQLVVRRLVCPPDDLVRRSILKLKHCSIS